MSNFQHTIETPDGTSPNYQDRTVIGALIGKSNAAGGGAGQSVATTITGLKNLPANYTVLVNPGQDATWWITNKTATGFTVNMSPRLAANTLSAGTFDAILIG